MEEVREEMTLLRLRGGGRGGGKSSNKTKDEANTSSKNADKATKDMKTDPNDPDVYIDPKTGKRYRKRKEVPSVSYMLAHGNPETAHLPKSKMQIIGYPVILALLFAISLLIFHYAPHSKSNTPKFELPKKQQEQIVNDIGPDMLKQIKLNQEKIELQRAEKLKQKIQNAQTQQQNQQTQEPEEEVKEEQEGNTEF